MAARGRRLRMLEQTERFDGALGRFLSDVRAGIGIDVVNSGDHVVGQEIATANLLALNWVGVRLTDNGPLPDADAAAHWPAKWRRVSLALTWRGRPYPVAVDRKDTR